ncbi:hypothetical protein FA13DRAFT_1818454 [Coprinellus micaceus]|uniref:Uncharacterized protein n=1 Tax=Coprinellus micaceus TaxID=71717 RepID=A0A4Y7SN31_COPMI|nr:hypothetical protein FA13DRAFT_1818454 [Coprinellus micaceus]
MAKRSKREKAAKARGDEETRRFFCRDWVQGWVKAITAPPNYLGRRRLRDLLSGPDPVDGAQARQPSMNEESLFYEFVTCLDLPFNAEVVCALDNIIAGIFGYAKEKIINADPYVAEWCSHHILGLPLDFQGYPGFMDKDYIVASLYVARMFALEWSYDWNAWDNLRTGVGLPNEDYTSDSTRIAACAQLLGGGQKIRRWCGGEGMDGQPEYFDNWRNRPAGKHEFAEILSALDTQIERTKSKWVKAVIAATQEHFYISQRDLTSEEVYEIIFEETMPVDEPDGLASGDEPGGVLEGDQVDSALDKVGDAAPQ